MSALSDYVETGFLNQLLRGITFSTFSQTYLGLHSSAPNEDGVTTNELTAANVGYARLSLPSSIWATPTASFDGGVETSNLPELIHAAAGSVWLTVTHVSIWTAAVAGNLLLLGPLNTPRLVASGQSLSWPPGTLIVKLK